MSQKIDRNRLLECRNDEAKMNRLFAYYKKINGSK